MRMKSGRGEREGYNKHMDVSLSLINQLCWIRRRRKCYTHTETEREAGTFEI